MKTVDRITVADNPGAWETLGFTVEEGVVQIGSIDIELVGPDAGRGILGWSLRNISSVDIDGLATTRSDGSLRKRSGVHPNGVSQIDHIVVFSPRLERTLAAFESAGIRLRRLREEPTPAGAPRQAFFRLGEVVVEVIQMAVDSPAREADPDGPARFWGMALTVDSLEPLASELEPHCSEIRAAIQPGRKIVTLKRSAGLSVPLAFITPAP